MRRCLVRPLAAMAASTLVGCAGYMQTKIELVEQARHGVTLVRGASAERRASIDALAARQRAQLDAAFDADVRARGAALDAGWAIDARRAYAVGLDTLAAQARDRDATDAHVAADLAAIDQALSQLQRMHRTELQFTLPELTR